MPKQVLGNNKNKLEHRVVRHYSPVGRAFRLHIQQMDHIIEEHVHVSQFKI